MKKGLNHQQLEIHEIRERFGLFDPRVWVKLFFYGVRNLIDASGDTRVVDSDWTSHYGLLLPGCLDLVGRWCDRVGHVWKLGCSHGLGCWKV